MNGVNQSDDQNSEILSKLSEYDSCIITLDDCKDEILRKIANINNLIIKLTEKINNLERNIYVKDLAGKLNRHYEQSRCCKRNS